MRRWTMGVALALLGILPGLGGCGSGTVISGPPVVLQWFLTGSMPGQRRDHTATLLLDGRVLVIGGTGTDISDIYDPPTAAFTQAASVTQLVPPRSRRFAMRPATTFPSNPGNVLSRQGV